MTNRSSHMPTLTISAIPRGEAVGLHPLRPQQLRDQDVAEDESQVERTVGSGHPVEHHESLVGIPAVPGEETSIRCRIPP